VSSIFTAPFASVYPHYVAKLERKGRTKADLDQVITWLTGFDEVTLRRHLKAGTTFEDFFAQAELNPDTSLITGVVCGIRVEDIEDPLMQKIRYLDKLVDELARGKAMDKVLRGSSDRDGGPSQLEEVADPATHRPERLGIDAASGSDHPLS
jgi:hypothetical protein